MLTAPKQHTSTRLKDARCGDVRDSRGGGARAGRGGRGPGGDEESKWRRAIDCLCTGGRGERGRGEGKTSACLFNSGLFKDKNRTSAALDRTHIPPHPKHHQPPGGMAHHCVRGSPAPPHSRFISVTSSLYFIIVFHTVRLKGVYPHTPEFTPCLHRFQWRPPPPPPTTPPPLNHLHT